MFNNSYSEDIFERMSLYFTDFSEELAFGEAIFRNSSSNIFMSDFYLNFVSLNTFISLNKPKKFLNNDL